MKNLLCSILVASIVIACGSAPDTASKLNIPKWAVEQPDLCGLGIQKFRGNLSTDRTIANAKAINIIAALEIANRNKHATSQNIDIIRCSKDAFTLIREPIGMLEHEEFWIMLVNNANKVLDCFQLSKGGITGTLVDCRLVFKKAIANCWKNVGNNFVLLSTQYNHHSSSLSFAGRVYFEINFSISSCFFAKSPWLNMISRKGACGDAGAGGLLGSTILTCS